MLIYIKFLLYRNREYPVYNTVYPVNNIIKTWNIKRK